MEGAKIFSCTCVHTAQDEMHGKRMRVFNRKGAGKKGESGTTTSWRCTVCGAERTT